MTASRDLSRREIALLVVGASLLACAMHWPLPISMGHAIPRDLGDPLGQTWQLAWIGHALLHQPGDLFQANIYWPLHNTLAFTDMLIGYAPAGMIGTGAKAALVRYDLLFLFAYALAFIGAYLLARELGVGPVGGAVAGAAFAYAPWRLFLDSALNHLSSGGVPLSIFLLLRGYRRGSSGMVLAGWLVAAWQLLLGIGLGIQLAYLLLVLAVLACVYWYRHRPALSRGIKIATAVGMAVTLLTTAFLARPYLQVRSDYPESARTLEEVERLSPPIEAFLTVPAGNTIRGAEPRVNNPSSRGVRHALFPGAVILVLATVGALAPIYPKRRRVVLVCAIAGLAILSLGYDSHRSIPVQPYRYVHDYLPGWAAIRAPNRLNHLTSLALALLASAGAQQLLVSLRGWRPLQRRSPSTIAVGAGTVLVALILAEGASFQIRDGQLHGVILPTVPEAPSGQVGAGEPQLHLPYAVNYPFGTETRFTYWSTDGFPEITTGWGGFLPNSDVRFAHASLGFPDAKSVERLRAMGVRTVIFHPEFAPGTLWANVGSKPIKGLPLTREARDGVVIFNLAPPPNG